MAPSYEIRVKGVVGDPVLESLGDLDASVRPAETVLRGVITDQAQLHGLLDRIQTLGLELIEIRRADEPGGSRGRAPTRDPISCKVAAEAASSVRTMADRVRAPLVRAQPGMPTSLTAAGPARILEALVPGRQFDRVDRHDMRGLETHTTELLSPRSVSSTRVSPPRPAAGTIARPRLFERLDAGVRGPLTVVTGSPGSGQDSAAVVVACRAT